MTSLAENTREYVGKALHQAFDLRPWKRQADLPALLRHEYDFFEGELFESPMLFMLAKDFPTPANTKKHQKMLGDYWDAPFVVVLERASSAWRSQMVLQGIQFVVPHRQMYLPTAGLDLRERFHSHAEQKQRLSPSTQVVFLHGLLRQETPPSTPTELGLHLGYSAMTVSRAIDQLESLELIDAWRSGRERLFGIPGDHRAAWEKAQPYLVTPVRRQLRIRVVRETENFSPLIAGLSALSASSMLSAPGTPVHATTSDVLRELIEQGTIVEVERVDDAEAVLQVWSYPPRLLSHDRMVDPLSLYLSLRDDRDERVQAALNDLLERFPW